MIFEQMKILRFESNSMISLDGSGLERKAATQVREFEKLAFAYFALVSLTSVHRIQKMAPGTAPGISGSPSRLTTLLKAVFFFFRKNGPHIFKSP